MGGFAGETFNILIRNKLFRFAPKLLMKRLSRKRIDPHTHLATAPKMGVADHLQKVLVLRAKVQRILVAEVACAAIQVIIFSRLAYLGNPGGTLMGCMMPPCERAYPIWLALCVFGAVAISAVWQLFVLPKAEKSSKSYAHVLAVCIALANFAIDVHYAHPIPHGGKSLHWSMHSNVSSAEQALSPLVSVVFSIGLMALLLVGHRAKSDLADLRRQPAIGSPPPTPTKSKKDE